MRNIDNDRDLLEFAGRYHTGDMSRDQYDWVLEERGYGSEERDCALVDYYWVYVDESCRLKFVFFLSLGLLFLMLLIHLAGILWIVFCLRS